jgi:RNA polymerase sigma-70 factor (ECF subfamily)
MSNSQERFPRARDRKEQYLLACARAGNERAFEELVMPHWDVLLRATKRILRNREDAEDAVQTALLHAWRNFAAFQGRSRFSSWLIRIAMNSAFMRLRASRRKNHISLDGMVQDGLTAGSCLVGARPTPEQEFSAKEVLRVVDNELHRLEPRYVEVLELSVVQELTRKEAARILDVPVTTVKSRLYRARGVLSRSLLPLLGPRRRRTNVADRGPTVLVPKTASSS